MSAPTLRKQLMRASMLTTGGALVLSAGWMLGHEFFNYRGERERDLQTQAEVLSLAIAPALMFNDVHSAERQLRSLQQKRGLLEAVVFDAAGVPFAAYRAQAEPGEPAAPRLPLAQEGVRHAASVIEMARRIDHDGERVGTLYLRARHDLVERLGSYAAILGGVVLAALGLAWLVFRGLQQEVIGPLSAVTGVARQVMDRRDWKLRAPGASSSEEVEVLVDAFNGMLSEMETTQARLLAADRKKDVFLATLAHELRNPLAPMTNAVQLLERPDVPPELRDKSLRILSRQLRHMVRLIDDLLDVSRIATGKLVLRPEPVDLVALVNAAVELIAPVARERGLQLQARLPEEACLVDGDAARLQQVFSNLLTNACRYTPAGGRVDVAMACEHGRLQVDVRDTGIGIDPSMQRAVFELFEQVDQRLERGNSGLGVGLTLARQLVLLHGGTLTLASDGIGHGSCFTVSLPRIHAPTPATEPVTTPAAAMAGGLSVVVADDNIDFADSLQTMLEALGHRVRVVHDGEAALAACSEPDCAVAILDIGMPRLNGYDVARRLRGEAPDRGLVLIAVSGWGRNEDKARAAEAGFDHHLTKPVDFTQLQQLLDAWAAPSRPRAHEA